MSNNLSKALLPFTGQTQEVMTNHNANDQKRTRANLPDVASAEYEEIIEPDYVEPHQMEIPGNFGFNLYIIFDA